MTRLWFAAKRYGYGWYPITWEGWVVIAVYTAALLLPPCILILLKVEVPDAHFALFFVPYVIVLSVLLIWIAAKKGEKARWRWGD